MKSVFYDEKKTLPSFKKKMHINRISENFSPNVACKRFIKELKIYDEFKIIIYEIDFFSEELEPMVS